MKFLWFFIVASLVLLGLFRERETKVPPIIQSASSSPTSPVGPLPRAVVPPLPLSQEHDEDGPRLQKIAGLARFALPSQETRDALLHELADPALQASLPRILTGSDKAMFQLEQEKMRMNAVAVLGLILQHKDVPRREDLLQFTRQRILAVDFDRMADIRVKQSVYGDITEMLMLLRQHDAETYADVAQRIGESNRKILQTALAASRSSI